jgi:hypothetical protein
MNNLYDFIVPTIPPLSEFVPDVNYDTNEVEHKICTRNNNENTMDIAAMDKGVEDSDDGLGAFVYQCSQEEKKMVAKSSSLNSERASKKRTRKISEDIHHDVQSKCTKIPKGKGDSITAAVEKTNRVSCSEKGCKNKAQGGGRCLKHGGKMEHKICTIEGCNNKARGGSGGVCIRHGAKRYKCKIEGCANDAKGNGRVCRRHGAKKINKKKCSTEGCKSNAQKGGLCYKHGTGYNRTLCTYEGCGNLAQQRGVCGRHGAVRKRCIHNGCMAELC